MKKRFISLILFFTIITLTFAFLSCKKEPERFTSYSFDYFDTVTSIVGYAESRAEFDEISGDILNELAEYHRLFTIYHRYDGLENLCTVNELANGEHRMITVDRRIIDMLLYAKEMYELTGGRVNIAMGSVLVLWHEYRELGITYPVDAELPPYELLSDAALHTDIDCMVIDEENGTVTLTDPKMKLDVGAIAKGYAVEMAARTLEDRGISGYVINVGGNVRTVGSKPDGTPWTVGIENPDDEAEESHLAYLNLAGKSLVTSGTYQRYYIVDGKRYHHIVDPDTLMPAEGYLMISVVTNSSAQGDALSTALFCMSLEDGLKLVESLPDTDAMWVLSDGTQHTSSGFGKYLK